MCVCPISLSLLCIADYEATHTNCTNHVLTILFELNSYFSIRIVKLYGIVSQLIELISSFASFKHTVQQIDFTPILILTVTVF